LMRTKFKHTLVAPKQAGSMFGPTLDLKLSLDSYQP